MLPIFVNAHGPNVTGVEETENTKTALTSSHTGEGGHHKPGTACAGSALMEALSAALLVYQLKTTSPHYTEESLRAVEPQSAIGAGCPGGCPGRRFSSEPHHPA